MAIGHIVNTDLFSTTKVGRYTNKFEILGIC